MLISSQVLGLSGLPLPSLHYYVIYNKSDMTSISAVASGPSYFSQGEDSLPPYHQSVGELVNWVETEIYVRSHPVDVQTLAAW